jgi:hypothetical protein
LPPEVPYRGYALKDLTLVPRPLQLPVECWQPIQGGSERALDFMAKHGIQGLVGGGSAEGGAMHSVVLKWQEAHARIGKHLELGERMCFGFHFYIADSREEGIREAAKYYEENMKMFGELRLVRALSDEQIEIMRDPKQAPTAKLPRIEDAINAGGVLCGSGEIVGQDAFYDLLCELDRFEPARSIPVPSAYVIPADVMATPEGQRVADLLQRRADFAGIQALFGNELTNAVNRFDADPVYQILDALLARDEAALVDQLMSELLKDEGLGDLLPLDQPGDVLERADRAMYARKVARRALRLAAGG